MPVDNWGEIEVNILLSEHNVYTLLLDLTNKTKNRSKQNQK